MGDEELNFTKDEAGPWADDPRNQAQEARTFSPRLVLCVLLAIAALIFVVLASSLGVQHDSGALVR